MKAVAHRAAALICSLMAVFPTSTRAQEGEARCRPDNDPLKYYMLRVDGALKKFDAAEVLEISKDGQICAATTREAATWISQLKSARQRIASDGQAHLDEIRGRINRNEKLKADVVALKEHIDSTYDEAQGAIKDSIKYVLDVLTAEGAALEKLFEATKGLLLSKALEDGALGFATDTASVILKGNGANNVSKGLASITFKELIAELGANAIAERWVKPALDHLKNIGAGVDEANARSLLENSRDYASALMVARAFLFATDRDIRKAEAYLKASTSRSALVDGVWESTDPEQRFRLECAGGACQWTERKVGAQLKREARVTEAAGGRFLLERGNDEEALVFAGYQPTLRRQILARAPGSSTLTITINGDGLTGDWKGLLAIKDKNANLAEIRWPVKTYSFRRLP